MLDIISNGLKAKGLDFTIVDKLLEAYQEAKKNFYLGGHKLSEVEAGRFCEAALRLLQQIGGKTITPLGRSVNSETVISDCSNLQFGKYPESVRIHIPRAIRVVYDIRSKRNAAHLADGIDANLQDATFVIAVMDWMLAEFIRIYHNVPADETQAMIDSIVVRRVPAIQNFQGFLKVLNPKLKAKEHISLCLYECGEKGASYEQLNAWIRPKMRSNLRRTLSQLVDKDDLVHFDGEKYILTKLGFGFVEKKKLHHIK